jgi:peptidoglycan-associated lipoprotein
MSRAISFVVSLFLLISIAGCAKKVTTAKLPPPPPQQAPAVSLSVSRPDIERGQSTQLSWKTDNASAIEIEGLGTVSAEGSRSVQPSASTNYVLSATGPGGTSRASARVTVSEPARAANSDTLSDEEIFRRSVKDAFFGYDTAAVASDQKEVIAANAAFFQQHPNLKIQIEGHCDERGSEEYNLALGVSRAEAAKKILAQHGISPERVNTLSYGKEKPFCTQDNEQCWSQNRRDHFVLQR